MDPNLPNYAQYLGNYEDLDPTFINHPAFQQFLQKMSSTSIQNTPQEISPVTQPSFDNYKQSPVGNQGSNSEFGEDEEHIPETPEYPPEPLTQPSPVNQQQQPSRIWSVAEDEALIASCLEHCTDKLIGSNQKASFLWQKVSASYDLAQSEKPHILPPRTTKMLENRWRRIAPDIGLWGSCYEEAGKLGSGYNEDDRIQNAHKIFRNSVRPKPRNFLCEHGWRMVTKEPKWRPKLRWALSKEERKAMQLQGGVDDNQQDSSGSGKRPRVDGDDMTDSSGGGYFSGGRLPRPDGVKTTKAKRKGKGVAMKGAVLSFTEEMHANTEVRLHEANARQQRLEMERAKEQRRQKQMELTEQQMQFDQMKMKFDMLQTLMSKATLTAGEEAFRDKLMQELYGGN
ncbi:glutathione S-transferase T3-like [Chenopodium quinoa]|uniref:glutathione S-transferase T3-like n=1 Tax=Chenopodium quinoa TaxID=63459 RepID=UPI000B773D3B|nr:glutathione S-transferase T3-like [Chenopodium quinoa]